MAVAKKVQKTVDSWKKKRWYRVMAPNMFNGVVIGETPAFEADSLLGRCSKVNMMTLTRNPRKQNFSITFEVDKVTGESAFTHVKMFEVNPPAVRRFVRRRRTRIDASFKCVTADGKRIAIKPFILTAFITRKSIETVLRKKAREEIVKRAKKKTYEMLIDEIINNKFQKEMNDTLSKIFPLKFFEIRYLELIGVGEELTEADIMEGKTEQEIEPEAEAEVEVKKEKKKAKKESAKEGEKAEEVIESEEEKPKTQKKEPKKAKSSEKTEEVEEDK